MVTAAAVLLIAGLAYIPMQRITSRYLALAPGSATEVAPLIHAPPDREHPVTGKLYLVTVSLRNVGPFDYLLDKLDSNVQVISEKALLGPAPRSKLNEINTQEMNDSRQTAVVVALRRLGYAVPELDQGALIQQVEPHSPAEGKLSVNDTVVSADGAVIKTADDLVAAIHAHKPGDTMQLGVQPPRGPRHTVEVTLAVSPPGQGPPHAFLGVVSMTKTTFVLPFPVAIDPGDIGGPSAGLAFTLGVMDVLTNGQLTGGHAVATTGTINLDGSVGDVGGVAQKTVAVRRSGAVLFMVPPAEYAVAVAHAGAHLKVVQVTTLEQALEALRSIGGDTSVLPPAPAKLPG
jgi:PDZ domain-containing protein